MGRKAHLIEEECGVRCHAAQAWRILLQLGMEPTASRRALERDEEKTGIWKQKPFGRSQKAKNEGERSSSSTKGPSHPPISQTACLVCSKFLGHDRKNKSFLDRYLPKVYIYQITTAFSVLYAGTLGTSLTL